MKAELYVTKEFLQIEDDKEIRKLPEFNEFFKNYKVKKSQDSVINILYDNEKIKEKIKEAPLPEELQQQKDTLSMIEKSIRKAINETEEKNR